MSTKICCDLTLFSLFIFWAICHITVKNAFLILRTVSEMISADTKFIKEALWDITVFVYWLVKC